MNAIIYVGLPKIEQNYVRLGVAVKEPQDIIDVACQVLKVKREDVLSKSRNREIVECRHIAMSIIRMNSGMALIKIGAMFNRDHSTVLYGIDTFNELYEFDKDFKSKVDMIKFITNNLNNHEPNRN